MGPFEMVVVIVLIAAVAVTNIAKSIFQPAGRSGASEARLQELLRQVRQEMAQLRKESQEVILSFDSSLQRLDARVEHLERKALAPGESRAALPSVEVGIRAR